MNIEMLMCRLTCSRCWRALLEQMADRPPACGFVPVHAGGSFLPAAQNLAVQLALPVRFVMQPAGGSNLYHVHARGSHQ